MTETSFHDWASAALPAGEIDYPALAVAAGGTGEPGTVRIDGDRVYVEGVTQAQLDAALAAYDPTASVKARLAAFANGHQWALATGGFGVTIKGQLVPFATTESALGLMDGKVMRLAQPNPPAAVNWQVGPTTFVAIEADDFVHAATLVSDFVQATFDALPAVFAGIAAGTIKAEADVVAATWPANGATVS